MKETRPQRHTASTTDPGRRHVSRPVTRKKMGSAMIVTTQRREALDEMAALAILSETFTRPQNTEEGHFLTHSMGPALH